ncbi:MAG: hypothetical protein IJT73_10005, partial [Selenomonadaceae bacterium]|nr:hypothetical protein [Selenomonadaceae bacterium]
MTVNSGTYTFNNITGSYSDYFYIGDKGFFTLAGSYTNVANENTLILDGGIIMASDLATAYGNKSVAHNILNLK